MDFSELQSFITKESGRLIETYPVDGVDRETYARLAKLMEEVGELAEQVLKSSSLQRKEKLAGAGAHALADEFADVMITTLLLAERMDIDINQALQNKIEKIEKRYT